MIEVMDVIQTQEVISSLCRLCGNTSSNGTYIFSSEKENINLCTLINKYLPLKVENDGRYPAKICPGCEIQLEATKLFFDLVILGQKQLEFIFNKMGKKPQLLSTELNISGDVGTFEIQSVETGEKYLIQIMDDATNEIPLYLNDHQIVKEMNILNKEKKKRGRPRKQREEQVTEDVGKSEEKIDSEKSDKYIPSMNSMDNDGKRHRKVPARFSETVQGKELDDILRKEGIVEDGFGSDVGEIIVGKTEIIGTVESENGEKLDERVVTKKIVHHGNKENRMQRSKRAKTYKCEKCSEEFRSHPRLKLHIDMIHNESSAVDGTLEVVGSNEQFEKISEYSEENNTSKEQENTAKEHTNDESEKPESINASASNTEGIHKCDECNVIFSCKRNLKVHILSVHEKRKPYTCSDCKQSFSYARSLRVHQLKHKKGVFPCEVCQKIFKHPSSLLYHRNAEHNNGKRYVCSKCDKSFKHRQLLQRHQLVHSEERPFKCDSCPAAFKTRNNLICHKAIHTGAKNYACSICGQTFAYKTSLNLHIRWHAGEKPYSCQVCSKRFSQKGNLFEHERIHTGEKPFCCDYCGRSFTTSSQLKLHSKRHTGDRPWKCELCPKTFLHKDSYRDHCRRHLNDRPFKCHLCSKCFTSANYLKKHMRFHTGEKPFICDICLKGFSDSSNLTKHRRTHEQKLTTLNTTQLPLINSSVKNNYYYVYNVGGPNLDLHQSQSEVLVNLEQDSLNSKNESIDFPLVDREGNPVSLNTQDGEQISVVTNITNEQENLQGLLPDGTWVSINLQDSKVESMEKLLNPVEEDTSVSHLLLGENMTFLDENIVKTGSNVLVSEQSEICFVTYDNSLE